MADQHDNDGPPRRGRHGLPRIGPARPTLGSRQPPRAAARGVPKLIRFVAINSAIGVVIGWAIAAALLWFNISGLGDMFARSDSKPVIIALMGMSFGVTFGFAYLSTAVMLLPTRKDDFDRL